MINPEIVNIDKFLGLYADKYEEMYKAEGKDPVYDYGDELDEADLFFKDNREFVKALVTANEDVFSSDREVIAVYRTAKENLSLEHEKTIAKKKEIEEER